MPLEFEIPDEKIQYFNQQAEAELLKSLERYAERLIGEAYRLEADQKSDDGDPQVISSHVIDSDRALRGRGRSRSYRKVQLGSIVSTLLVGVMFDFQALMDAIYLIGFLIVFAIALGTTFYLWAKE